MSIVMKIDYEKMASRISGVDLESIRTSNQEKTGYVKKEKGKYCVKSEKNPDWSGGCYNTKEEADKRLQQVEMFKHMKKK